MKRVLLWITLTAVSARAADIDHSPWDALLKRYVDQQHLVDYATWKRAGLVDLDHYLAGLAAPWPQDLSPAARKAALLNAYNCLTIRWIITNYPVASVWRTRHPFTEVRHRIDNRAVSLDAIETELRNMGDPRIHAALVCAARSCPPLRREAYAGDKLDPQLDANVSEWLAMRDRNQFIPGKNRASVSMIFKWYKGDFEKNGGSVEGFLAKYAPSAHFLLARKATLKYAPYHWGLNDTSDLGRDYSSSKFYWDYLRNKD
jgi:Protein of unknown function, DUF547